MELDEIHYQDVKRSTTTTAKTLKKANALVEKHMKAYCARYDWNTNSRTVDALRERFRAFGLEVLKLTKSKSLRINTLAKSKDKTTNEDKIKIDEFAAPLAIERLGKQFCERHGLPPQPGQPTNW